MKKRIKQKIGENGFSAAGVMGMALVLVLLTGCSGEKQDGTEPSLPSGGYEDSTGEMQQESSEPDQELEESNPDNSLSADGQEIKDTALQFAEAYFRGDVDAMKAFLIDSYEGDMDVHVGEGTISEITIKGLEDPVLRVGGLIVLNYSSCSNRI